MDWLVFPQALTVVNSDYKQSIIRENLSPFFVPLFDLFFPMVGNITPSFKDFSNFFLLESGETFQKHISVLALT